MEENPSSNSFYNECDLLPQEITAFQEFISNPNNISELEEIIQQLNKKYGIAKTFAENIVQCQKNILAVRKALESNNCNGSIFEDLNSKLIFQQSTYREAILQLQNLRKETDHLKHGLQQVKIKLVQKFRDGIRKEACEKLEREKEKDALKESCRFNATVEVANEVQEIISSTIVDKPAVTINCNKPGAAEGEEVPEHTFPIPTEVHSNTKENQYFGKFLKITDNAEFVDFMKTVPLTGDDEVDDEIFSFYRTKFNCK